MDRRRETRWSTDAPLTVNILGDSPREMPGRLANISGRGMRVLLPEAVEVGAAVRLELDDTLMLGEVCYCARYGDAYAAGFELEQSLAGLGDLRRLMMALMGEDLMREDVIRADAPAMPAAGGPAVLS